MNEFEKNKTNCVSIIVKKIECLLIVNVVRTVN